MNETYQDLEGYNIPIGWSKPQTYSGTASGPFGEAAKYFTPNIEDIRVGYECEWTDCDKKSWRKTTLSLDGDRFNTGCRVYGIKEMIDYEYIRVPYLTKEQIEAEGWKEGDKGLLTMDNKPLWSMKKEGFGLLYIEHIKYLSLYDKFRDIYIYQGSCKDINTFRYICKLLGI